MAWFFINDEIIGDAYTITGEDAKHISKSLRMRTGEKLTLVSSDKVRHECEIINFTKDTVLVNVIDSFVCEQEPTVKITLFMSLLKGDKMEDVIQKSVELGVSEITPVITNRCISRPDNNKINKKIERWQKIAQNAASQCRRGIIPKVNTLISLDEINPDSFDKIAVFYEDGGEKIRDLFKEQDEKIGIIIGSEGGFEIEEIEKLKEKNIKVGTLGKRILRAQTAPLAAITAIMYETKNME